jgi:hypothetical protein
MSIFFRVHEDATDTLGTLYDRKFQEATATRESDLVLTTPRKLYDKIREVNPAHLIIRVHQDKTNQNPDEGRYYDEDFRYFGGGYSHAWPSGSTMILTITPDEFGAMKMMKR